MALNIAESSSNDGIEALLQYNPTLSWVKEGETHFNIPEWISRRLEHTWGQPVTREKIMAYRVLLFSLLDLQQDINSAIQGIAKETQTNDERGRLKARLDALDSLIARVDSKCASFEKAYSQRARGRGAGWQVVAPGS